MMNDTTRTRLKVRHGRKHTSETWQAQRLAVRRSFLMQRTNMGSDLPRKRDGTFLLSRQGTGYLLQLWVFSLSFFRLLLFFSYPAFERPYPFCGFSLRPPGSLFQYTVYYRRHTNILALYARASNFR